MQIKSNVANFVNNFEFFSICVEYKGLLLILILNQTRSACNPLVFYKFKVRILKTDQLILSFNFKIFLLIQDDCILKCIKSTIAHFENLNNYL